MHIPKHSLLHLQLVQTEDDSREHHVGSTIILVDTVLGLCCGLAAGLIGDCSHASDVGLSGKIILSSAVEHKFLGACLIVISWNCSC